MKYTIGALVIRPTRFPGLCYSNVFPSDWRFVDGETGCTIGAIYRTKAELLADLASFAAQRGFDTVPATVGSPE